MSEESDLFGKLQDYQKAIASEFAATEAGDTPAVINVARKKIATSYLNLIEQLLALATNAESESVQLAAIKFAHEIVAGKDGKNASPGFSDLLKQLAPSSDA